MNKHTLGALDTLGTTTNLNYSTIPNKFPRRRNSAIITNFDFPKPVLVEIFKHFNYHQINGVLSKVNKRWNLVAKSASIWKDRFEQNFIRPIRNSGLLVIDDAKPANGAIGRFEEDFGTLASTIENLPQLINSGNTNGSVDWCQVYHIAQHLTTRYFNCILSCGNSSLLFLGFGAYDFVLQIVDVLLALDIFLISHRKPCEKSEIVDKTIVNFETMRNQLMLPVPFVNGENNTGALDILLCPSPEFPFPNRQLKNVLLRQCLPKLLIRHKHYDTLSFLNLNSFGKGCTALTYSLKYFHNAPHWFGNQITSLILHGVDTNQPDSHGDTPLVCAISNASAKVMSKKLGTNVETLGPIHSWNISKHIDTLLKFGADPNLPNGCGVYPLHLAYELDEKNLATKLLEYGANPMVTNNRGMTVADITNDLCEKKLECYQGVIERTESCVHMIMTFLFIVFVFNIVRIMFCRL